MQGEADRKQNTYNKTVNLFSQEHQNTPIISQIAIIVLRTSLQFRELMSQVL